MHYNTASCILDVFILLKWLCSGRIGLGWAHDVFTIAYHMLMHFHAYVPYILYIFIYLLYLVLFCVCMCVCVCVSFSLPLSLFLVYVSCVMTLKRKSTPSRNPLRSGASTSFDPTPSFVWFRDDKALQDFSENFSRWGVHSERQSFYHTSPTLTYPLSFTIGVGSHCVTFWSFVHSCWYRSSTPTYMDLIIQYLFLLLMFEVRGLWPFWILYLRCSVSRG